MTAALAGSLIQTLGHRRSPAFVTHFIPPCHCDSSIPLVGYLHPPGSKPRRTRFSERMSPLSRHLPLWCTIYSYIGHSFRIGAVTAALHSNSRPLKVTGFRDPFHVVRDSVDCLHPPGSIPSRTRFSECVSPLSRHLSLLVQLFTLASDTVFILAGSLIQTLGDRRSPAFVTHFIPPCHL